MDSYDNERMTRRKFVREVAGTGVCCACLSLSCEGPSGEDSGVEVEEGGGKEYLPAACGTYCGACPAYIAKHGDGKQNNVTQQKRVLSGPTKAGKGIPPSNWMDGLSRIG